eukprot:CAMPEP_0172637592 /NCGR_PEP_ID=MMETSP1068-20121228/209755_1 /TAXON_ID=35684 /ORGANISM="Pseudopedinella elastica, Strain CCMP716" /LENGTH=36 /DNA_ID= /DNA_START= /DNA_END= /DNA_ORIENTATION=
MRATQLLHVPVTHGDSGRVSLPHVPCTYGSAGPAPL